MPVLSQLLTSNRALGRLPATPIASIDENSLEARECRRFYPEVVSDMLGGPHNWSFANKRQLLASVTNDRTAEWAFAYALPSSLGSAIRVIPDFTALGLTVPIPLPGDPYAEMWASQMASLAMPYEIEGNILYTQAANATLDFGLDDVTGLNLPQRVLSALSLDLASRIAVPIKQDSAREKELITMAEVAWQRAIADDDNRQPETYGSYIPESIAARHGDC